MFGLLPIGILLLFAGACHSLRDVRISVPIAVKHLDDATLECHYDMEGDALYSVKWYLGTTEFFRYTPKESPRMKQFPTQTGLVVRESGSNGNRVVLERVPMPISGRYSCEVSADAPSFFTNVQSGHLQVVELPKKDPFITGVKTRYHQGEILRANCTSERSNPATNLTWFINGELAERPHFLTHKERTPDGFYSSQSTLRIKVTKQLFVGRKLKIRCVARMYDIYYKSNEKSVEPEKKRHSHHHHQAYTTPEPSAQWELVQVERPRPETTLVFQASSSVRWLDGSLGSLALLVCVLLS